MIVPSCYFIYVDPYIGSLGDINVSFEGTASQLNCSKYSVLKREENGHASQSLRTPEYCI